MKSEDKRHKNIEILIPYKDEKAIPEYLLDFIANDPNFIPEIQRNNLEDAFMSIHSRATADFRDGGGDYN